MDAHFWKCTGCERWNNETALSCLNCLKDRGHPKKQICGSEGCQGVLITRNGEVISCNKCRRRMEFRSLPSPSESLIDKKLVSEINNIFMALTGAAEVPTRLLRKLFTSDSGKVFPTEIEVLLEPSQPAGDSKITQQRWVRWVLQSAFPYKLLNCLKSVISKRESITNFNSTTSEGSDIVSRRNVYRHSERGGSPDQLSVISSVPSYSQLPHLRGFGDSPSEIESFPEIKRKFSDHHPFELVNNFQSPDRSNVDHQLTDSPVKNNNLYESAQRNRQPAVSSEIFHERNHNTQPHYRDIRPGNNQPTALMNTAVDLDALEVCEPPSIPSLCDTLVQPVGTSSKYENPPTVRSSNQLQHDSLKSNHRSKQPDDNDMIVNKTSTDSNQNTRSRYSVPPSIVIVNNDVGEVNEPVGNFLIENNITAALNDTFSENVRGPPVTPMTGDPNNTFENIASNHSQLPIHQITRSNSYESNSMSNTVGRVPEVLSESDTIPRTVHQSKSGVGYNISNSDFRNLTERQASERRRAANMKSVPEINNNNNNNNNTITRLSEKSPAELKKDPPESQREPSGQGFVYASDYIKQYSGSQSSRSTQPTDCVEQYLHYLNNKTAVPDMSSVKDSQRTPSVSRHNSGIDQSFVFADDFISQYETKYAQQEGSNRRNDIRSPIQICSRVPPPVTMSAVLREQNAVVNYKLIALQRDSLNSPLGLHLSPDMIVETILEDSPAARHVEIRAIVGWQLTHAAGQLVRSPEEVAAAIKNSIAVLIRVEEVESLF